MSLRQAKQYEFLEGVTKAISDSKRLYISHGFHILKCLVSADFKICFL